MGEGYDVARLRREEFPWTLEGEAIYLNAAGTGPLPARSVRTLNEWALLRTRPWRLNDHETVFPALAHVRALCARLLGAHAQEIALVPNTSWGLNLAARALPLAPGDVALVSDREFPSAVYAWQAAAQARGLELKFVPTQTGMLDESALLAALDTPRVRVLTLSWVSFATGCRVDLQRLGHACRERGIFFVIDAMQGLGPETLDVEACGADIVACGGHKWLLSPWGTGFVYVRQALLSRLPPPAVSWFLGPGSEDYAHLLDYDLRYYADARRFEVPTLPAQDLAAMGSSLELLFELGVEAVQQHVRNLANQIVHWVERRPDMRLVTPADPARRAGIVTFVPRDTATATGKLRDAGVIHSLREGGIRLAPHCYNTPEEIDTALAALA